MSRPLLRPGLGARLALSFAMLAAITALVTAGVSAYSTNRQVNADVDRFLEVRSLDISEGRRADLGLGGNGPRVNNNNGRRGRNPPPRQNDAPLEPDEVIQEILSLVDSDADVQILDEDGNVVAGIGAGLPVEAIDEQFLTGGKSPLLRTIEIDGEPYRLITRHTQGGGLVQVARSLSTTNELLRDVRSELLIVGVLMSGLAAFVGWGIAQGTTRPLRKLTKRVETVATTEDLSTSIALERSDEIGRLSEEFDVLLKTLGASRDQQQRLVQDAAHELRTPLTSVRANIDFLEHARDLDADERQTTLRSIKAELAELSEVLAEVVELATESRGSASFELVDLAGIAESALAQFELRTSRPIVRQLNPSVVLGDAAALSRAASNLLNNADKYSPSDLPITIGVEAGALWVSDQGPGIEPSDRVRIFDRFYRSDRDRSAPGSGLGLAIVAKAAQEHGGQAWATEAIGGGAKVGFTVPTAPVS